jgi:pimeloyl-ACP methyl ester carboxylesterase
MKHPIAAAAAALALFAACASAQPQDQHQVVTGKVPPTERLWDHAAAARLVTADPPRDAAHPARNRQLVIRSGPPHPRHGRPAEMNALFFLASGAGPKPTMILLHGLPGNERNLDLAQAVRRSGWNVLTFTYRGAWGSEGSFSIEHAIADAGAALAFLRTSDAAARYGVDPRRIVLAGHSMGAFAAAATAEADGVELRSSAAPGRALPPVAGLVLLDAWDIARTAETLIAAGAKGRADFIAGFDDIGRSLGPVTAADLADELARRGRSWDLKGMAPQLARLPVLTVYATHGIAADNKAIAEALRTRGARLTATELDTDHSFADKRIALAVEVVKWLQALPQG